MLGGGLLAAGVAGVVSVGVALLAANQGLLLDEAALPRIAHRWTFLINLSFSTKTFSVRSHHQDIRNGPAKDLLNGATSLKFKMWPFETSWISNYFRVNSQSKFSSYLFLCQWWGDLFNISHIVVNYPILTRMLHTDNTTKQLFRIYCKSIIHILRNVSYLMKD